MVTPTRLALDVPGPRPVPVLGPTGNVFRMLADPVGHVGRLFRRWGDVVSLAAGGGTRIYSSRPVCPGSVFVYKPEHAQEVATRHDVYHKHPLSLTLYARAGRSRRTEPLKHFGTGLFGVNDEEHRRHRRILMPAFQKKPVESYHEKMVRLTQETLDGWRPGQRRDLSQDMRLLTLRIATSALFGGDVGEAAGDLGRLTQEALVVLGNPLTLLLPLDVPGLPYRRFLDLAADMDGAARALVARKRQEGAEPDVLSRLVRARDEETGTALTDDDLIGHTSALFSASHETSANALTWTLFLLSQHPRVAADLVDELNAELRGAPPAEGHLDRLPLLDRVVRESLRVISVVPFNGRIVAKGAELGGYALPEGTEVFVSLYHTHHMPELYARPEAFDPDRWRSIDPTVFEYEPFSAGPRMCIGATFALLEIKIVLAMLLQRYRLELARRRVDRFGLIVLVPRGGLTVEVREQDREFARGVGGVRGNVRDMVDLPA